MTAWSVLGLAGAAAAYECANFLLTSPRMALLHPDQISVVGNHYAVPERVREVFAADRRKSVLRIPIERRQQQLQAIPWIEQVAVRRVLPNRIQVDITERTPIAFLRHGSDLSLVDVHGVILEKPIEGDFHFPVVTGIGPDVPLEDREQRMQLFSKFIQEIGEARSGAADQVSEVDLSDAHDVRATLTDLENAPAENSESTAAPVPAPVLVHFGDSDFAGKYQTLVDQFSAWLARAGRIDSVDLRFSREAVVNQDPSVSAARPPAKAQAQLH